MLKHTKVSSLMSLLSVGVMLVVFAAQATIVLREPLNRGKYVLELHNIAFGYGSAPVCPNGSVETGEVCDDGNMSPYDSCLNTCQNNVCGDAYIDTVLPTTEGCDDGGVTAGDGCSATCTVETGYVCTGSGTTPGVCFTRPTNICIAGTPDGVTPTYPNPPEQCDDGNISNLDTCTNTCWDNICGDGYVESGVEDCDDGNLTAADGCSATCTVESNYVCTGTAPSTCHLISCGDTVVDPGEDCDAGAVDTETCDMNCTTRICGDQYTNTVAGEQCDDGNISNTDACLNTCLDATCGDTYIQSSVEACDGGGVNTTTCDVDCSLRSCGDNYVNSVAGETCDEGGVNTLTCDSDCSAVSCGDSILNSAAGETCDDGNALANDGCSSSCTVETGYTCPTPGSACAGICSDGLIRGEEACDDGNDVNYDGCSATGCFINFGYACDGVDPSVCTAVCGDGYIYGAEACDDGGTAAGDGCSSSCTVETGYTCTGEASTCTPICGDGDIIGGEACDDNNTSAGDGCSSSCTVETGYSCSGEPSVCANSCGNSVTDPASEECDDGNLINTDACTNQCDDAVCTDGFVWSGSELCDDGNAVNDDGCSATGCFVNVGFTCTGTEPSVCSGICGDNLVRGDEPCDDGDLTSGDGCSNVCAVETGWICTGDPSVCQNCGNSLIEGTEVCDDGNNNSEDGCSAQCTEETGYICAGTPSVCELHCGNNTVEAAKGEECDDGNVSDFDACTSACLDAECSDGYVRTGVEICDDGNDVNYDGCSSTGCFINYGYACDGVDPSVCSLDCGDGLIVGTEACDDGNEDAGDGCSASCTIENGWYCTGEASVCTTDCGDGIKAGAEQCDDDNDSNFDACLNVCETAVCGDGFVRTGIELCEPPGSGTCNNTCTFSAGVAGGTTDDSSSSVASRKRTVKPFCGNGVFEKDKDEECDAGRFNGLSPYCDLECKKTFCGDGVVHPESEECEPERTDNGSYVVKTCGGQVCSPPGCTEDGCEGGCVWVFLPACKVIQLQNASSEPSAYLSPGTGSNGQSMVANILDDKATSWYPNEIQNGFRDAISMLFRFFSFVGLH